MKTASILLLALGWVTNALVPAPPIKPNSGINLDIDHDGYFIPHDIPDGNYQVIFSGNASEPPLVKRYCDVHKRWKRLSKRTDLGGSGEYWIVIDEDKDPNAIDDIHYDLHAPAKLPLPISGKGCFTTIDYNLNKEDYFASKQAFYNYCAIYGFTDAHVEFARHGSVAVFACIRTNGFSYGVNYCSEGEYKNAEAVFNQTCGELKPAYVSMSSWVKDYGRAWPGIRVCGKAGTLFRHTSAEEGTWKERKYDDGEPDPR